MLISSKSLDPIVRAGRFVLMSPTVIVIAFSVGAVVATAAVAHGGGATDQSSIAAKSGDDVATDNSSRRLASLEARVRRIEAVLAADEKARAERQQKLESGYWGRLDGP